MKPVFFLNFKTYENATGKKALKLAQIAEHASESLGKKVVLVVQPSDIRLVAGKTSLEIFAQHIDPVSFGSNTGKILPESVKQAGASGTILNHAENRIMLETIGKSIARAKEAGLKTMVCAETAEKAREIALFSPVFIAIEPPELIGGPVSVTNANPKIITDAVNAVNSVNRIPVIAGAGINSVEDVRKSIELGTKGVFVASAVVNAKSQKQKLFELLKGM